MGRQAIRRIARLDTKAGDNVTLADGKSNKASASRLGQPHNLDLIMSCFSTVLCIRADDDAHINMKEGQDFLSYFRWLLRVRSRHGRRIVVLVDSRVWIGAAAKGWSGPWPLNRLLRLR